LPGTLPASVHFMPVSIGNPLPRNVSELQTNDALFIEISALQGARSGSKDSSRMWQVLGQTLHP
jgi:hypothetical protein